MVGVTKLACWLMRLFTVVVLIVIAAARKVVRYGREIFTFANFQNDRHSNFYMKVEMAV